MLSRFKAQDARLKISKSSIFNLQFLKERGFTLIELLVVIAIIGILAAILMPALSRARETSRRSVCRSNLKDMGNSLVMYANDWGEKFPQTKSSANTVEDFSALIRNGKYNTGSLLYCPSDRHAVKDNNNVLNGTLVADPNGENCTPYSATCKPECSYAYAFNLNAADMFPTVLVSAPPEAFEIMYAVAVDRSGADSTATSGAAAWSFDLICPPGGYKNHQNEGYNVLKIDGHVEWCSYPQTPTACGGGDLDTRQAIVARVIPNVYVTSPAGKGFLANP